MVQEKQNFGLIGKNISYSFSKKYFLQKFLDLNLAATHTYQNFDLENLKGFKKLIVSNKIKGLNVTIPYKERIINLLDEIDNDAKKIGAVNTIKIDSKYKLIGYNTDYIGFINSIPFNLRKNIKKALVLGSGGASKAITYGLKKLKIEPIIVSRKKTQNYISYENINKNILMNTQMIINCSPIGTFPKTNESPKIPYEHINQKHTCYDLVYNPKESLFLKNSKKNNAKIINGLKMLKIQAEESWKIWKS